MNERYNKQKESSEVKSKTRKTKNKFASKHFVSNTTKSDETLLF